jgi:hypothetical protein
MFATFLQRFCNIFATFAMFLQRFCNFFAMFATFLQQKKRGKEEFF